MKTIEEKLQRLNIDPTSNVVKENQSGYKYLEGYFVIEQLNSIFGNTGWSYEIKDLKLVSERDGFTKEKKDWKTGEVYPGTPVFFVGYICQINLIIPNLIEGGFSKINDVGFGSGINADMGKAHESATKEAATDGLKRCAKALGAALGLTLYDKQFKAKSPKFDDEENQTIPQPQPQPKSEGSNVIIVRALVTQETKDLAKSRDFKWNPTKMIWTKQMTEKELASENFIFNTEVVK